MPKLLRSLGAATVALVVGGLLVLSLGLAARAVLTISVWAAGWGGLFAGVGAGLTAFAVAAVVHTALVLGALWGLQRALRRG